MKYSSHYVHLLNILTRWHHRLGIYHHHGICSCWFYCCFFIYAKIVCQESVHRIIRHVTIYVNSKTSKQNLKGK